MQFDFYNILYTVYKIAYKNKKETTKSNLFQKIK